MNFKLLQIFITFLHSIVLFSQSNLKKNNEELIFAFETTNGKKVFIGKDKNNAYLVYRYGTNSKIEFEYPSNKDAKSWKKFQYSYYLRGGGIQNEAMDLNELSFENEGVFYIIYQNYVAHENKYEIGINIEDIKHQKIFHIIGRKQTQKGTIAFFRENSLVIQKDDLFER